MKWVFAGIAALLLGAAIGWRGEVEGSVGSALDNPAPSSGRASGLEQSGIDRGADAFGQDWRSWADRVRAAKTSSELEELLQAVPAIEDHKLKSTMYRLLGVRWAEVDPEAGFRFLTEIGLGPRILPEMMTEWALRDPVVGLKKLKSLIYPAGSHVPDEVQERLSQCNPKAALEMIRALGKYANYPKSGLKKLATAYPEELAALIVEIETARLARGESFHAYGYISAVAAELAERDPRAAMEWAIALKVKRIRDTARQTVIDRWAEFDPQALAKYIEERGETLDHTLERRIEDVLAGGDLDKIVAASNGRGSADRSLSTMLARQIEEGALTFEQVYDKVSGIETNRGSVRYALMRGLWSGMSTGELSGALEVLQAKPEGAGRRVAMEGLLGEWRARDHEAVVAAMAAVPAGAERDAIAECLLVWSDLEFSAESFKKIVEGLPIADRVAAIGGLLEAEPGESVPLGFDPRFFAETLAAAPDNAARAEAVERLATFWGDIDPAWAMEWAMGLGGEGAARVVAKVAEGWAQHDLFSLSIALLEMPAGAARESATGVLVEALIETEPGSAWEWARRLDDPGARQRVLEAWVENDVAAAREAVEAAELPAAEREALRAVLDR